MMRMIDVLIVFVDVNRNPTARSSIIPMNVAILASIALLIAQSR